MNTQVVTALIAAAVSLTVSIVALAAARLNERSGRQRQERELQRKLTEKLYDLRIHHYPRAFSLTRGLLGDVVSRVDITQEQIDKIREELADWNASDASFILSKRSLEAYYALREALAVIPSDITRYSAEQREAMWRAKNVFRARLRDDVHLLFTEDRSERQRDTRKKAEALLNEAKVGLSEKGDQTRAKSPGSYFHLFRPSSGDTGSAPDPPLEPTTDTSNPAASPGPKAPSR